MRRKQLLLIITTILCTLILSSSHTFAAQQVKIPYVVSVGDWWTGIAITNNSGDTITDMKLYFTTDEGASSSGLIFESIKTALPEPIIPGPIVISYSTDLAEIAEYAMLVDSLENLYTGEGTKTLPSDTGSVIIGHTGDQEFYVTVYIGSSLGFAFQVFESTSP